MTPKRDHVRLAQSILNTRIKAGLTVDGLWGRVSVAAARKFVGHIRVNRAMTNVRWLALTLQHAANLSDLVPHKILEDGWYGPATEDAAYRMMGHTFVRPDEPAVPSDDVVRPRCWYPSDRQMIAKYGQPGSGQVVHALPFPMVLAWDLRTTVRRASMHRLFVGPYTGALEEVRDIYGIEKIKELHIDRFGGILNVRKKRGGSTWSAHAWGTAADHDPDRNRLAWKKNRAAFARPEYAPMRLAFQRAGLMSLGECADIDWMHWQLNP